MTTMATVNDNGDVDSPDEECIVGKTKTWTNKQTNKQKERKKKKEKEDEDGGEVTLING